MQHDQIRNLIADLERSQQHASALHTMLREAQSGTPGETRGSDRSGAVAMVADRDGFPESIRVAPDWVRRVRPDQFGAAVGEASRAARAQHMAAAVEGLERMGWRQQASRARAEFASTYEASGRVARDLPSHSQGSPGSGPQTAAAIPRPLGDLVEEALKAFEAVEHARPPVPAQGTGRAAGGWFALTLTADGAVSCSVDPRWVSGQTPTMLANAFGEALAEARLALGRAQRTSPGDDGSLVTSLPGMFNEVIALLRDPERLTRS